MSFSDFKNTSQILSFSRKNLEKKFQTILDCMPVPLSWANSSTGKIEFVNRSFIATFGYDTDDIKTIDEWYEKAYVNPSEANTIREAWSKSNHELDSEVVELDPVENEIICKDGTVKSIISTRMNFPQDGWSLVTFTDITERKRQEKVIYDQAMKDHLTGLLNRRAFDSALNQCLSSADLNQRKVGLLILDLDKFKPLNDNFGHDQGDLVLKEVATRLKQATRQQNVCRIGGDEFGVIIDDIENLIVIEKVIDRIFDRVCADVNINGQPHKIELSIGLGVYPDDAKSRESLYKYADNALYRAKNNGRGQWSR